MKYVYILRSTPSGSSYKNHFIFFTLFFLALTVSNASGKQRLFNEKVTFQLLDYRDFERRVYFELDAPFDVGGIRQLSVGDGKSKLLLDADHFSSFGWPMMDSVRVTSSSEEESIIYVRIPFAKNKIDDPELNGRKCSLVIIIKDFEFIYEILSVEIDGIIRSYFFVPESTKATGVEGVRYVRYSELSSAQREIIGGEGG